ncbi:MAG: hypothetical protein KIT11_11755 [Fimbriimonadaceae bacterium]|nr:hypothetical protein [Fimbriimonadaceae bacterium]QYK55291.1 MAG: hypothetical protein KF733_09780 [Fimbriimonadaceae bacterium]
MLSLVLTLALRSQEQTAVLTFGDLQYEGRVTPSGWQERYTRIDRSPPESRPALLSASPETGNALAGRAKIIELDVEARRLKLQVDGEAGAFQRTVELQGPDRVAVVDYLNPGDKAPGRAESRYEATGEARAQGGRDLEVAVPGAGLDTASGSVCLYSDWRDMEAARPGPYFWRAQANQLSAGIETLRPGPVEYRYSILFSTEGAVKALTDAAYQDMDPLAVERAMPQTIPFRYYTRYAFGFGAGEEESEVETGEEEEGEEQGGWRFWETETNAGDVEVGHPGSAEEVEFGPTRNALAAAFGMRSWGLALRQTTFVKQADSVLALLVSGPKPTASPWNGRLDIDDWDWVPGDPGSLPTTATWVLTWVDQPGEMEHREQALDWLGEATKAALAVAETDGFDSSWAEFVVRASASNSVPNMTRAELAALRPKAEAVLSRGLAQPSLADLRLADALSVEASGRDVARTAARSFLLRQALWQAPSMPSSSIGLVVSSEGGRYLAAEQAAGLSLLRIGLRTGDQAIAQRGALALRAGFRFLAVGTGRLNGLTFPEDVPDGTAAIGAQNGLLLTSFGFEDAGALLAAVSLANQEFGGLVIHPDGWAVGLDGVQSNPATPPVSTLGANPISYGERHVVEVKRFGEAGSDSQRAEIVFGISRVEIEVRDGRVWLVMAPSRSVSTSEGEIKASFDVAGKQLQASLGLTGLEVEVSPAELMKGPVTAKATFGGEAFALPEQDVFASPPLNPAASGRRGWRPFGGLVASGAAFARPNWIQTEPGLTGSLRCPDFTATAGQIVFQWEGGENTLAELIDARTERTLAQAEGRTKRVVWDLTPFVGEKLYVRLVDRSRAQSAAMGWPRFEPKR